MPNTMIRDSNLIQVDQYCAWYLPLALRLPLWCQNIEQKCFQYQQHLPHPCGLVSHMRSINIGQTRT